MSTSLVVFFFIIQFGFSQTNSILLIEYPNKLVFFDEFEQKIQTPQFASLTPFEIVNRNTTLSDQLTKCISVKFGKKKFYILKNKDNKLVNNERSGLIQILKNIPLKKISIEISLNTEYYTNVYKPKKNGEINSGIYERFIELNNYSLVKIANYKFVWIKTSDLKYINTKTEITKSDSSIQSMLKNYFQKTNSLYKRLCKSLKTTSNIPIWVLEEKEELSIYKLNSNSDIFSKQLFNEVHNDLLKMKKKNIVFNEALFRVEY